MRRDTTNGCTGAFEDGSGSQKLPHFATLHDLAVYISTSDVQLVDCCFADCFGRWHHTTFAPAVCSTAEQLARGFSFDGSSIKLFTTISTSDLLMCPDPSTCWIDPFGKYKTLHVTCDVCRPDGTPAPFCPKGILRRAHKLVTDSSVADLVKIGPEGEFFVFDSIRVSSQSHKISIEISQFDEGPWSNDIGANGDNDHRQNLGHRSNFKGYYMPVAPVDSLQNLRSEMLMTMGTAGLPIEKHHHECAAAQGELGISCGPCVEVAEHVMTYKYLVKNVAARAGKSATFMPKPLADDNGSGFHCNISLWRDGRNLFFSPDGAYHKISKLALCFIGGILSHAPALLAITNPTVNSYRRLVPGFEAPCVLVYSAGNRSAAVRIPITDVDKESSKRIECRFPDSSGSPHLTFAAIILAGLDGVANLTQPPAPIDKNIYQLAPDERAAVRSTPRTLWDALDSLELDNEFLCKGGAFTKEFVKEYIRVKRLECLSIETIPHPKEFQLYYSC